MTWKNKGLFPNNYARVLGDKFLLTIQEQLGDVFESVRERIRKERSRIRCAGIDYLEYALLDTVVGNHVFII